ncbi:MAG TPA: hypothetical protein VG454_04960, partial [Gemmatimonadales bacterium]|nr:hypothetical protein [Gemmatimonadales bacterium]
MVKSRSQLALSLALAASLGACKDSTSVTVGTARLRIVNSVFQGDSAQSSAPVAVDVLIDSSMSGAGLSALAAASVSPGSGSDAGAGAHSGTANLFPAAGYRALPSGVHRFVAR